MKVHDLSEYRKVEVFPHQLAIGQYVKLDGEVAYCFSSASGLKGKHVCKYTKIVRFIKEEEAWFKSDDDALTDQLRKLSSTSKAATPPKKNVVEAMFGRQIPYGKISKLWRKINE